jgi:hypothetical protein
MATPHVKVNVSFGLSPTDVVVRAWLEKHGVDPADVMAYRVTRGDHHTTPTIELTMFYSEEEAVTDDGVPS